MKRLLFLLILFSSAAFGQSPYTRNQMHDASAVFGNYSISKFRAITDSIFASVPFLKMDRDLEFQGSGNSISLGLSSNRLGVFSVHAATAIDLNSVGVMNATIAGQVNVQGSADILFGTQAAQNFALFNLNHTFDIAVGGFEFDNKPFSISGATTIGSSTHTVTLNTSGNTSVTLPTSGTLATQAYADAKVADAINDGVTTIAPSQNAVFDLGALKQNVFSNFFIVPTTSTTSAITSYISGLGAGVDVKLWFPAASYTITSEISYTGTGRVYIFAEGGTIINGRTTAGNIFNIGTSCTGVYVNLGNMKLNNNLNANNTRWFNLDTIDGTISFSNFDIINFTNENHYGLYLNGAPKESFTDYDHPGLTLHNVNFYNQVLGSSFDYNNNNAKGIAVYANDFTEYAKVSDCSFSNIQVAVWSRNGANWDFQNNHVERTFARWGGTDRAALYFEGGAGNNGKMIINGNSFNHNWGFAIISTINDQYRPLIISDNMFISNAITPINQQGSGFYWKIQNNFFNVANFHTNGANDPYSAAASRYIVFNGSFHTVSDNTFLAGVSDVVIRTAVSSDNNLITDNYYQTGLTFTSLVGSNDDVYNNRTDGTKSASWLLNSGGTLTANNTITGGAFTETHTYDGLTNGTALSVTSNNTNSTASTQILFNAGLTGAHGTTNQTTVVGRYSNAHSGSGSINVAGQFNATGGGTNYAIQSQNGDVILGGNGTSTSTWLWNNTTGQEDMRRATTNSNTAAANSIITSVTNQVMADGYGGLLLFRNRDGDAVDNSVMAIGGIRDGADNSGKIALQTSSGGTLTTRANIAANGNVSIGNTTVTGNSTLHVSGSFATAYVAKTALYTLTASDYLVEVTSGTHTQTLPTAVGITGRTYIITNSGSGTVTVGTTSSQTFVNVSATPTTLTLNQFQTVIVTSNGANWLRVSTL